MEIANHFLGIMLRISVTHDSSCEYYHIMDFSQHFFGIIDPVKFLKLYLHTTSPSPQGVTDDTVQGVPAWAYKDVCYQKRETMGFSIEITQC